MRNEVLVFLLIRRSVHSNLLRYVFIVLPLLSSLDDSFSFLLLCPGYTLQDWIGLAGVRLNHKQYNITSSSSSAADEDEDECPRPVRMRNKPNRVVQDQMKS